MPTVKTHARRDLEQAILAFLSSRELERWTFHGISNNSKPELVLAYPYVKASEIAKAVGISEADARGIALTLVYRGELEAQGGNFDAYRYPYNAKSVDKNDEQGSSMQAGDKDTYVALAAQLREEMHAARMQIAAELAPALNIHIRAMPHGTYDEKRELARWVNAELEPLGLAVQCPKTGLPAKLRGMAGHWRGIGRFGIEVSIDGKQKTPTVSDSLPELTLTDAAPPREAEVNWQKAVKRKDSQNISQR